MAWCQLRKRSGAILEPYRFDRLSNLTLFTEIYFLLSPDCWDRVRSRVNNCCLQAVQNKLGSHSLFFAHVHGVLVKHTSKAAELSCLMMLSHAVFIEALFDFLEMVWAHGLYQAGRQCVNRLVVHLEMKAIGTLARHRCNEEASGPANAVNGEP